MTNKLNFLSKAVGPSGLLLATALTPVAPAPAAQERDLLYIGLPPQAKSLARETVQDTLETVASGEERQWRNPQGIERGYIQPLRTFKNGLGQYCREYAEELHRVDGIQQRQRIACRDDDGIWRIVVDEAVSHQG